MSFIIPSQTAVGQTLKASKWQKLPLLINEEEMKALFTELEPFWIVQTSGVISIGEEVVSHKSFLELYQNYVQALKKGEDFQDSRLRPYFSSVLTLFPDALYTVKVNDKQCLVKVLKPVVQLQIHRFDYCPADDSFRSMGMNEESISWGIQFSYPSIAQGEQLEIVPVREGDQFPNTSLYKKIQRWTRQHTIATPFEVKGKTVNVPIRLGKNCLEWINDYPRLQARGLRVNFNF